MLIPNTMTILLWNFEKYWNLIQYENAKTLLVLNIYNSLIIIEKALIKQIWKIYFLNILKQIFAFLHIISIVWPNTICLQFCTELVVGLNIWGIKK